jgi:putative ABC transport system permease protein
MKRHSVREWVGFLSLALAVAVLAFVFATSNQQRLALQQLAQAINPNIFIAKFQPKANSIPPDGGIGLNNDEVETLRGIDGVKAVSFSAGGFMVTGQQYRLMQQAIQADYGKILGLSLSSGRWFTTAEAETKLPYAVIGPVVAEEYFQGKDPVGQTIVTGMGSLKVVGVLKEIPPDLTPLQDLNASMLVPDSKEIKIPGERSSVFSGIIEFEPGQGARVRQLVSEALNQWPTGQFFELKTPEEWLGAPLYFRQSVANTLDQGIVWTAGLVVLAAIANLSNLFALRVWDRLTMIGIRRSFGATRGRILAEIGVDTLRFGLFGGLAGLVLFMVLVVIGRSFWQSPLQLEFSLVALPMAWALALGIMITLIAATLPALQALQMPIARNLRHPPQPLFREGIGLVGFVLGLSALMVSTTISDGAERWVKRRIEELGGQRVVYSNRRANNEPLATILPKVPLKTSDVERLSHPGIANAASSIMTGGATEIIPNKPMTFARAEDSFISIIYNTASYFDFAAPAIEFGRKPKDSTEVVLGSEVVAKFFAGQSPEQVLSQRLRLRFRPSGISQPASDDAPQVSYAIVGILGTSNLLGSAGEVHSSMVLKIAGDGDLPYGFPGPTNIHVSIRPEADFEATINAINQQIQGWYPGNYTRVRAVYPAGDFQPIRQALRQTANAYFAIAVATFFIGLLGLSSVMLLRVVKKMQEIALRRAVGSNRQRLTWLFWRDAYVLITIAAGVALILGLMMIWPISQLLPWQLNASWPWLLVTIVAAWVFGSLASLYPAWLVSNIAPAAVLKERDA